MIKKLRQKFIAIAMLSVFIVLTLILGIINIRVYSNVNVRTDEILSVLTENEGRFPNMGKKPGTNKMDKKMKDGMSPETPYETRYFTVFFDDRGNVSAADTGFVAAISTDDAMELAKEAYENSRVSKFIGNYKYKKANFNGGTMVVFIDCSRDLDTVHSFVMTSIIMGAIGMILVFILVVILSKIVVKPMAESYDKQKRFITDASHEIKTPLSIISANTDIVEMENGESQWTKSIRHQVERMTSLTNSLVSLARMDEGVNLMNMKDFSLSDAVFEEAEYFESIAQSNGKSLKINIEENISYKGDEKILRQLVCILLDNAMKYSNDGGNIEISLKKKGRHSELCVSNSVDNIEKGNHDILFDRFYRGDSSRNSGTGGYGIGLSMAESIVKNHKGSITSVSPDSKTIKFICVL